MLPQWPSAYWSILDRFCSFLKLILIWPPTSKKPSCATLGCQPYVLYYYHPRSDASSSRSIRNRPTTSTTWPDINTFGWACYMYVIDVVINLIKSTSLLRQHYTLRNQHHLTPQSSYCAERLYSSHRATAEHRSRSITAVLRRLDGDRVSQA